MFSWLKRSVIPLLAGGSLVLPSFSFSYLSASVKEKTQSLPVPEMLVTKARNANAKVGDRLGVGVPLKTNKSRFFEGHFVQGGEAEATLWAWGVRLISVPPGSSVAVKGFGYCVGGGRNLELSVKGQIFIQTRYLTQTCSTVKVFPGDGKGGVILKSSAQFKELTKGRYVVGLIEGHGIAQDAEEKTPPVSILAGQYSVMAADGAFSPPVTVSAASGYRVLTQTKTTHKLQALEGYKIKVRGGSFDSVLLPIGVPFEIVSPLNRE
jgi:hypothetical protein